MKYVLCFSDEQQELFDNLFGAVIPDVSASDLDVEESTTATTERPIFLHAPGVTVNTFVASEIQMFLKQKDSNTITVPSSAVESQLLGDGRTAHSAHQIPIPSDRDSKSSIFADSPLAENIRNIDVLLWDEIVRTHRYNLQAIERMFRDITRSILLIGE